MSNKQPLFLRVTYEPILGTSKGFAAPTSQVYFIDPTKGVQGRHLDSFTKIPLENASQYQQYPASRLLALVMKFEHAPYYSEDCSSIFHCNSTRLLLNYVSTIAPSDNGRTYELTTIDGRVHTLSQCPAVNLKIYKSQKLIFEHLIPKCDYHLTMPGNIYSSSIAVDTATIPSKKAQSLPCLWKDRSAIMSPVITSEHARGKTRVYTTEGGYEYHITSVA